MRRERIDLRVTQAEKEAWEKLAARRGMTLSELIRQSIEDAKPKRSSRSSA